MSSETWLTLVFLVSLTAWWIWVDIALERLGLAWEDGCEAA